jgi:hypothetical protein
LNEVRVGAEQGAVLLHHASDHAPG